MLSHQRLSSFQPNLYATTSMVSLIVPPTYNLQKLREKLNNELSTANNIKSRINRSSVKSALTKLYQYTKTIKQLPRNGIALYAEQSI